MATEPVIDLTGKIGELIGVIKGLTIRIDDLRDDMSQKISRDTAENIVNTAIEHHRETDHRTGITLTPKQKTALISALAAIATIFGAATGLNRQQGTLLHFIRIKVLAMDQMRHEQQIVEGQVQESLRFLTRPIIANVTSYCRCCLV